jgi:fructose-1,6-bisphosphatase/inositol monophosphatase family enzyme
MGVRAFIDKTAFWATLITAADEVARSVGLFEDHATEHWWIASVLVVFVAPHFYRRAWGMS